MTNLTVKFSILVVIYILYSEFQIVASDLRSHKRINNKCSKCPPGWGVVKKCNKLRDTSCKRCETGKSYSHHYSLTSPCWLCSRCGVGLYESCRCSPTRDTVCNECTSFIDHKNLTPKNDFIAKCSYLIPKYF